jgi:hypothetical protein
MPNLIPIHVGRIGDKIEPLMVKPYDKSSSPESSEAPRGDPGRREIIIPYLPDARPTTAVKHVAIHMSLTQLQESGYYERYVALIEPSILVQLHSGLAMSWTPIELALAHYQACENLMLTNEQLAAMGTGVGTRVSERTLVMSSKPSHDGSVDLWNELDAVQRMWARLYQGGNAQVVKIGPKEMLLEVRDFRLTRFHYYRQAQVTFISSAYRATGARLTGARLVRYSAARDEVTYRFSWE